MSDLFQRITLDAREKLTPHLASFRFVDLGFTALYYCAEAFDICYRFIDDTLCLRIRSEEGTYAYVLSSTDKLSEIAALLPADENGVLHFDFVKEQDLHNFCTLSDYTCEIDTQDKYADYFCSYADYIVIDKQASLHKYKDYNQFLKRFTHEIIPLESTNLSIAAELLERWCAHRDCADCTTGCEKKWILRLFEAWDSLDAKGVIVRVDGVPAAFCILEQNGDTVMRLVGKSPDRILGLQVFFGVESVKLLYPNARFVNLGPDSGVPGIRQFKEKFRPYEKLYKYTIQLTRK